MSDERIGIHADICDEIHELYEKKNADYGDAFRKVRDKMPNAILVRLNDKLNRLESLMNKPEEERKVKDESIDDTLIDIANYSIMELVERRAERDDEDEEDDEDDEYESDTIGEAVDAIRFNLTSVFKDWERNVLKRRALMRRDNIFDDYEFKHTEVFGFPDKDCDGWMKVYIFEFDEPYKYSKFRITMVKKNPYDGYAIPLKGDCYEDLHSSITLRNDLIKSNQKHFEWYIVPNSSDYFTGFNTFYSFTLDGGHINNTFVRYDVAIDMNRPIFIKDINKMFEEGE